MGWTQVYMAMENDLELWNKVLNVIIDYIFECAKTLIEHGVKTLFSVDCLTPWVGAELFEKPVWMHGNHPPELYERIYDKFGVGTGLHPCTVGPFEIGIPVWKKWLKHTPGFIMSEFGGADALARAKMQLAPATMIGNIHPNDVMLHGNPAIVERTVKDLIKKCAPGGRYVIAPGCVGLPFDVPVENVRAIYDAAEKYGKYPIEL